MVVQARDRQTGVDVGIKIIKRKEAYVKQAHSEIRLLEHMLKVDPTSSHHIGLFFDIPFFLEC